MHHATAKVEHRALGFVDHLRRSLDGLHIQLRPSIGHGRRRQLVEVDKLILDVLGHIDQHRARPTGHGDAEGLGDHGEQFLC